MASSSREPGFPRDGQFRRFLGQDSRSDEQPCCTPGCPHFHADKPTKSTFSRGQSNDVHIFPPKMWNPLFGVESSTLTHMVSTFSKKWIPHFRRRKSGFHILGRPKKWIPHFGPLRKVDSTFSGRENVEFRPLVQKSGVVPCHRCSAADSAPTAASSSTIEPPPVENRTSRTREQHSTINADETAPSKHRGNNTLKIADAFRIRAKGITPHSRALRHQTEQLHDGVASTTQQKTLRKTQSESAMEG